MGELLTASGAHIDNIGDTVCQTNFYKPFFTSDSGAALAARVACKATPQQRHQDQQERRVQRSLASSSVSGLIGEQRNPGTKDSRV